MSRFTTAILVVGALAGVLPPSSATAQLDTQHWLPTVWAAGSIGTQYLVFSTPETSPVSVTVTDGAGSVVFSSSALSNSNPIIHSLGGGEGAVSIVGGPDDLNLVNTENLTVVASAPIYCSMRHIVSSQGMVLTAKGRKALGTDFRVGMQRSFDKNSSGRGVFVSVMATEDDTTITYSDFKSGVALPGTTTSGSPATTQPFSVTIDAGEGHIIGSEDPQFPSAGDYNDLNGTRVTADKPVVITSGGWLQGPSGRGQDIGVDQLAPVDTGGQEFVLIIGNAPNSSILETPVVLVSQPDTNVFLNGSGTPFNSSPMQPGDYLFLQGQFSAAGNMLVQSDKPIQIFQSIGGSSSEATPGAFFVPPLGADAATFIDNIPNVNQVGTANLGIIARAGQQVLLNGSPISVAPSVVPGSLDWVTYKTGSLTGTVSVESTAAIAVALINVSGATGAAGYFSGFAAGNIDLDEDGIPDGSDNCQDDPNPAQTDSDSDGAGDVCDECPSDPAKVLAGVCGCGVVEGDPDNDGVVCTDNCPFTANANQADADLDGIGDLCEDDGDADGTPDPLDGCPTDPNKTEVGECGCFIPETDSDLDGTPNCNDGCPADQNKTSPGSCGCGTPEGTCLALGDLNESGTITVADASCSLLIALNPAGALPPCLTAPLEAADMNCDESRDISDVLLIVFKSIGIPFASEIDANGDGTADACESP